MTSSGTERACWVARTRSRSASRSGPAAMVMRVPPRTLRCRANNSAAQSTRCRRGVKGCQDARMIEDSERRRVVVVLVAGVVVMLVYWTAWYADRSLVASNSRSAYYEFENAFPLADAWLTVALIGAAWTLSHQSPMALFWLLAGGGAGLYLFGMDVLYDAENGIWWNSGAGGVIELVINVVTLVVSIWLLRWAWQRRDALLAGS